MPGAGSDVRRRNRLIVAVSVAAAVVVVALLATHRTSAPVQLPAGGGTLTSGEFDGSCDGFDDSFPCSGNVSSVVAVDVRRSRFLVVWIANLTRSEHGHEVGDKARARFVSTTGRLGPTITLANDDVNAGLPISASYQAGRDRFVISWSERDHFVSAFDLSVVAPSQHSSWTEEHTYGARGRNVKLWGPHIGQRGRLPRSAVGLAVWDDPEPDGPVQVHGQILPPGQTCQGRRKCPPLGPT